MISNYSKVVVTSRLKLYIDGELQIQNLKHPSKFMKYEHRTNDFPAIEQRRSPIFQKDPLFKHWNIQQTESRLKSYINGKKKIGDLVHPSKFIRFSPITLKQKESCPSSDSIEVEPISSTESKYEPSTRWSIEKSPIREVGDMLVINEDADSRESMTHKRDFQELDPTAGRTTFSVIPEQETSSREQRGTEGTETMIFTKTPTNMLENSNRYPQRKCIKPTDVTETLDTRHYESLKDASKFTSRHKLSPKCHLKHFDAEMRKYHSKNRSTAPIEEPVPEFKYNNRQPDSHKATHSTQCSNKSKKEHRSSTKKSNEKTEALEKLQALQTEIDTLTERNRNLEVRLQREQVQNDVLQVSLQCLKERAESKIDEIVKNFNLVSEKLIQAQNDLRTDLHPDFVKKQAFLETISRLEEENNQCFSQKLKQKLSHITESIIVLQEQKNRLMKTLESNETPYLLNSDILGIF